MYMNLIATGIIKDNNSPYNMNIFLEKMNYYPGETIQGLVKITSNEPIAKNLYLSLKICLILKHIEYWHNKQSSNSSDNETPNPSFRDNIDFKKHYKESVFFSKEELISNLVDLNNNNTIFISSNKEINIPVNIEVPQDIKPSLEWCKSNNIYCYSRTILSINIPELKIYSNYYLFIQRNGPSAISGININKIIGKKSLLFFWDNDNIKIDASLEKDSYPFFDLCPFQIKIDTSELKSKLNSIVLTLKRKIKFLVNGEQNIHLNTCDYIDDLWEQKIILEKNEKNHLYDFNIPLLDNDKIAKQKIFIFKYDLKNFNKKYLSYLIPTYSGPMIMCDYFIKIKPIFDDSNISYSDFMINFDLYHKENSFSKEAIKEINKMFFDINKMVKVNFNDKNNINNYNVYSSSCYSLPDEEMLRKYYSNRGSPPMVLNK